MKYDLDDVVRKIEPRPATPLPDSVIRDIGMRAQDRVFAMNLVPGSDEEAYQLALAIRRLKSAAV